MIVVDVNLLVYAYALESPQHLTARRFVERAFSSSDPVRLPWTVLHSFMRLTTTSKIVQPPRRLIEIIAVVDQWLTAGHVQILEPGTRYWPILQQLLRGSEVPGALISDAHLAALAIENDATIYSADRDFRRFAGLRVVNPLL